MKAAVTATAEDIEAVLAEVAQRWRSLELDRLEELWDTSHPPLYIAEEADEIHTSFEAIRRYWTTTRGMMLEMGVEFGRPAIIPLGDGLVTAVFTLHWECLIKGQQAPVGGDNRASAVFRRVGETWRFTQYVEAPLAPIVYIRRLYERSVTPGFGRRP